ncbi:uncharacterized protein AAG666_017850 isoform 5-T14 [Megaptera novaeangliae]
MRAPRVRPGRGPAPPPSRRPRRPRRASGPRPPRPPRPGPCPPLGARGPSSPGRAWCGAGAPRPPDEAALPAGAEQRASRRRRTEAAGGARSGRRLRAAGSGPGPKSTDGQRLVPRPQPQPESHESVLAADLVTTMRSACVDRLPASLLRPEQVLSQCDQATTRRRGSCPVSHGGKAYNRPLSRSMKAHEEQAGGVHSASGN